MSTDILESPTPVAEVKPEQTPIHMFTGEEFDAQGAGWAFAVASVTQAPTWPRSVSWWPMVVGSFSDEVRAFPSVLFAAPTQGTVVMSFRDVLVADTADEVFTARVRGRASAQTVVAPSRAWTAFTELATWLGIGKVATASLLGISRGTTNAWKRGGEPQPANDRRLHRTHTVVKTLIRRMGIEEARNWLESGDPSPLKLLGEQDFAAFDKAASALVFDSRARDSERVGVVVAEPDDAGQGTPPADEGAPTPRRVRRSVPRRRAR